MSITIATDGMIRFFEGDETVFEVPLKTKVRTEPKLTGKANREPSLKGKVCSIRLQARVVRCDT